MRGGPSEGVQHSVHKWGLEGSLKVAVSPCRIRGAHTSERCGLHVGGTGTGITDGPPVTLEY